MTRIEWLQENFPGFKIKLVRWKQFDGPIDRGGKEVPREGYGVRHPLGHKSALFGMDPHKTDEERAKWLKE